MMAESSSLESSELSVDAAVKTGSISSVVSITYAIAFIKRSEGYSTEYGLAQVVKPYSFLS